MSMFEGKFDIKNREGGFYCYGKLFCPLEYIPDGLGGMKHLHFVAKTAPVEAIQNRWEFSMLLEEYVLNKPKNILEIGSYEGGTLWYWFNYGISGAKIVSIDLFQNPFVNITDKMEEYTTKWRSWVPSDMSFSFVHGDSRERSTLYQVKKVFNNELIDFLFIDGDHAYDSVLSDFNTYGPMVAPGGIIAMHDIENPDIARLWEEIRLAGYKTKTFSARSDAGIGVVFIE